MVAVISALLGIAINLISSQVDTNSLPLKVAVWPAVIALILVSARLELKATRSTDAAQLQNQAAKTLRSALLRRWEDDPVWQSVIEGGRLPVRWQSASPDPIRDDNYIATEHAAESDSERLGRLWIAAESPRRLVLFGEAGSGKSELLVAVFRSFLAGWEKGQPVPVLIPAMSWNPQEQGLRSWLVDWLLTNHQFLSLRIPGIVSRTLAEALLDDGQLSIILDGFDEIAEGSRIDAVRGLNNLEGPVRLLIGSRVKQSESVHEISNMFSQAHSVVIEAQSLNEVLDYLEQRSSHPARWAGVRQNLPHRDDLASVLRTPLMVMLADTIYNQNDSSHSTKRPDPDHLLSFHGYDALSGHLLDGFLPARYPAEIVDEDRQVWSHAWTASDAGHWLGYLARMLGNTTDLRWWDLRVLPEGRRRPVAIHGLTALGIAMWTALSAGILNGWAFDHVEAGSTSAVRISVAALIAYFAMLYMTGSYASAVIGAAGAYMAGAFSGTYDLAVGVGMLAGFSWRPLTVRRTGLRTAALIGTVVVAASAAIRGIGLLVPLKAELTQGFAAGFADGFTTRWDEDVNGWLASGIVATAVAWVGLRATQEERTSAHTSPPRIWSRPIIPGLATGLVVAAIDSWADGFRPSVTHAWLLAPADGLAAGLAVWWASFWAREWSGTKLGSAPRQLPASIIRPALTAALIGLATFGLNVIGYSTKTDIHAGWARALSEGLAVGALVWFTLTLHSRPADRMTSDQRIPLSEHLSRAMPVGVLALLVGALDVLSAGLARGLATGIGIGLAGMFLAQSKRRPTRSGSEKIDPIEAGIFALTLVGLIAGLGYGLFYGLVAGLGSRVAGDIAQRKQPAARVLPSFQRAAGGALLGGIVVLAAAFKDIPLIWLVVIGATNGLAWAFAFGVQGLNPKNLQAASPQALYHQDRAAFLVIVTAAATALAIASGARTMADVQNLQLGALEALFTLLTYGVTAGLIVATSATRFGRFTVLRLWLAGRGELPWRLMRFLDDAHTKRQALRSTGSEYQFRHQYLQQRIATMRRR